MHWDGVHDLQAALRVTSSSTYFKAHVPAGRKNTIDGIEGVNVLVPEKLPSR